MSERWRETGLTLLPALLVAAFSALLLLKDPAFFWHDDGQTLFWPAFTDIVRALRAGEWPLLSQNSWFAGHLAGEFQFGVFSLWILGLLVAIWPFGLTLPMSAAAFSIAHLMVLAAGTFRLARAFGLSAPLGLLAAVAATLNGWNMVWAGIGWLSHLTTFAWLPWVWWGLLWAIAPGASPWRFLAPSVFLYMLIAAGWPPTVIMMGAVTLMVAARAYWRDRDLAALWPIAAAWGVGLGLSAPAWLMFLEYICQTTRSQEHNGLIFEWMVPLTAWWGALYPGAAAEWTVYFRQKLHLPVELANGIVPAVALVVGLVFHGRALWRRAGWELALLGLMVVLCALPGFGMFRWSFRWLPLVHLLMGLSAGLALAELAKTSWKRNPGLWALVGVAAAWAVSLTNPVIAPWVGLPFLAAMAGWAVLSARGTRTAQLAALGASVLALGLTYWQIPTALERPAWPIPEAVRQTEPFDPQVRYLALAHKEDYFGPEAFAAPFGVTLRPGNTYNYAGIEFVNGYSSLGLKGLAWILQPGVNGFLRPEVTGPLIERELGPAGLLRLLAVDGLVLGRQLKHRAPDVVARGWKVVAESPEGVVLHREGPASPRVRSLSAVWTSADFRSALAIMMDREGPVIPVVEIGEPDQSYDVARRFAPATLTGLSDGRLGSSVEVSVPEGGPSAMVVFARPWYPGFEARLDGKPLRVKPINLVLPGVEVPAGSRGKLELVFRPWGLTWGLAIAGATLLALLLALLGALVRRAIRASALPIGQHG